MVLFIISYVNLTTCLQPKLDISISSPCYPSYHMVTLLKSLHIDANDRVTRLLIQVIALLDPHVSSLLLAIPVRGKNKYKLSLPDSGGERERGSLSSHLRVATSRHCLVRRQPTLVPDALARAGLQQPGTSIPALRQRGEKKRAPVVGPSASIDLVEQAVQQ